jgi:quinol monooxygenase YgiN
MLVHTAHLVCRADVVEAFKKRLLRHARTTLETEQGCHRFDVHQDRSEPTRFLLIEHYADESALEAHRKAPHYLEFRKDTEDWVVGREWWFWEALG